MLPLDNVNGINLNLSCQEVGIDFGGGKIGRDAYPEDEGDDDDISTRCHFLVTKARAADNT